MFTEKEKLEAEIKLLKESLELDVITPDEYETAKARVEEKIISLEPEKEKKIEIKELKEESDLEQKEEPVEEESAEETDAGKSEILGSKASGTTDVVSGTDSVGEAKEEEPKEAETEIKKEGLTKPEEEEQKKEDAFIIDFSWLKNIFRKKEPVTEEKPVEEKIAEQKTLDEIKEAEERPQEEVKVTEEKEEVKVTEEKPLKEVKAIEEKEAEEVKEEKPVEEVKEEVKAEERPAEEVKEEEKEPPIVQEEKKSLIKTIVYSSIFIVLILIAYFFFFGGSSQVPADESDSFTPISLIGCNSDKDCIEEGKIGICNNPGQESAECEYIEDVEIKLTILNNNGCFNCKTGRVLSILNGFFPNLDIENIDFETDEGKEIKERFFITALPAYIVNSSFKESYNYNKFSSSFNEARESFVMKNTVSNANFYIDREEIPNKLDLFVKQDQTASTTAEDNLEEFLDVFEDNVIFEKHNTDSKIVKELGINSFPAFLINNKIKFSGVQSADKIRENFCHINSVTECASGLSKSLV